MKTIPKDAMAELEQMRENAKEILSAMKEKFEELSSTAQEYYDERSEKWQESEKGESYSTWVSDIDDRAMEIDNLIDELDYIDFDEIKTPQ